MALLALTPVLVAAGRVILFSRGDPVLLSALGRSLDVPGVLLGGVVPSLGLALSLTLYVIIANRHVTPVAARWFRELPAVPLTALMAIVGVAILTTPQSTALTLLALPALGFVYRAVTSWWDRRRGRYIGADVSAIVAGYILVILQASGSWMATEVVTLSDDSELTAYVVSTEDGWTTLVGADDREVLRVPAGDIVEREVCGAERGRTLLQWINGANSQPPCS